MARPTVALTGATGFFGRHLADSLRAAGCHVRALVRPGREAGAGIETVTGSLDDEGALDALVAGADAVLHAAGATKALRPEDFLRVNAEGTARLFERAALHAPGARMALVSSLAAREPQLSAYARSKHLAEGKARDRVDAGRLLIVRPPALYGPHDLQTLAMFRSVRLPFAPLVGNGRERIALSHVEDAASATVGLLMNGASGLYNLADARPEGYPMREIVAEAARAQGLTVRLLALPPGLCAVVGQASALFGRLARRPVLLTPDKVREMLHEDWSVDPATMPSGLSGRARGIARGFDETVAWYRKAAWL